MADKSLTETLAYLYLTHRPNPKIHGAHDILDKDGVIFTGHALQVWRWLKETGRISRTDEA